MNKILILCGPSGCGKTYIERELSEDKSLSFKKLIQVTTRPMRKDESQGNPYFFINIDKYKALENDLIGKTKIITDDGIINYYGTINNFDKRSINTVILNRKGIDDFLKYYKKHENEIKYFILMIDSTKPVTRENRSEEFIKKERASLEPICNMILWNHPDKNIYVKKEEIISIVNNFFKD